LRILSMAAPLGWPFFYAFLLCFYELIPAR
jgi:hypothetical protein